MNCICKKLGRAKCADPLIDDETGAQSCGIAEELSIAIVGGLDKDDDDKWVVNCHKILAALPARLALKLGPVPRAEGEDGS